MDPIVIAISMLVLLIVLLLIRVPVAFALMISGALGIVWLRNWGVASTALANISYDSTAKYSYTVIPMFMFMGLLAMHGGIAKDLFASAQRIFKKLPGALALATIMTCAFFAAVSGSSIATAATVGRVSIKEMVRYGYSAVYAAGVVAAGGTLGILIPPSIILVIYGIITTESIGDLLLAGILPGILSAVMYGVGAVAMVLINKKYYSPKRAEDITLDQAKSGGGIREEMGGMVRIAILFIIVMGGIYSGIVTVTESAALGALAALIMLVLDLRKRKEALGRGIVDALKESAGLTSMVFAIVVGAAVFSYFLVLGNIPTVFTNWVLGMGVPRAAILGVMLVVFLILGMILDPISIILLTMPIVYPIISELGYSGIWFGVIVVKMIEIGLMTPPVGLNVFVVAASTKNLKVEDVFVGVMPFVLIDLITVAILVAMPSIVTWLPEHALAM